MNRLLLSIALLLGLLGSALGQSISPVSGGSAAAVIGPSGAPAPGTVTDNALVRWDGTTGTQAQNSLGILSDTGVLTGLTNATIATGTITTSQPLTFTQTWNASGVTFTGVLANFTNTASATGSLLLDLQLGGTSLFKLSKAATATIGLGGTGATDTTLILDGSSAATHGAGIQFSSNSVAQSFIGPNSFINGSGTSPALTLLTVGAVNILLSPGNSIVSIGGLTSAFPAFKRNGINIDVKLADDSTYSSLAARGIFSAGAVPTLVLAGGTCAGTVIAGGSTVGTVTLTGACVATNTMTLSVMPTAPTGYVCDAIDRTLGSSLLVQTGTSTTTAVFTFGGTTGATDVLAYKCIGY